MSRSAFKCSRARAKVREVANRLAVPLPPALVVPRHSGCRFPRWLVLFGVLVYLAYLTAVTHGLTEDAERLKLLVPTQPGMTLPEVSSTSSRLLQPPTPIIRTKDGSEKDQGVREEDATVNWPLLTVPKSAFEGSLSDAPDGLSMPSEDFSEPAGDAWGDDLNLDDDAPGIIKK